MYISGLSISGYRSLKDVEIRDMLPVCIFHGLNNSGKSNILSALETLFRRKEVVEETVVSEVTTHKRKGSFWQGRITGFRDNFYKNGKSDITFSVSVAMTHTELKFMADVLEELNANLVKTDREKIVTLSGKISYVDEDNAEMVLGQVVIGKNNVIFQVDGGGKKAFFPKLTKLTAEKRLASFEALMDRLADSFVLLQSDRYLTVEQALDGAGELSSLTSKTFKRWLFHLSLDRSGYSTFEAIKFMFGSDPFSIGELGFSKDNQELEIMVKGRQVRLPIGRLGSGHQQILYIVANLVLNKGKMLGIEELEINLSPAAQKVVFEKIKNHIFKSGDLVTQVIITSHSNYFSGRKDVRCYGVEHNGEYTTVSPWTKTKRAGFFGRAG
jgi:predicted ATPase